MITSTEIAIAQLDRILAAEQHSRIDAAIEASWKRWEAVCDTLMAGEPLEWFAAPARDSREVLASVMVSSKSEPGKMHVVAVTARYDGVPVYTCGDCPGYENRNWCSHCAAAEELYEAANPPAPSAEDLSDAMRADAERKMAVIARGRAALDDLYPGENIAA